MKFNTYASAIAFFALALTSCDNGAKHLSIEGTIGNAKGQKVYLDRVNLNPRETVDSVQVGADGAFRFQAVPTGEPTFYEVRLADNRSFPVLVDTYQQVTSISLISRPMLLSILVLLVVH